MFLNQVIQQERRSSAVIKMHRRASELPPEVLAELKRRPSEFVRRRSSIFRPPPPVEPTFFWKKREDDTWAIIQDDGSETTLVHQKKQASSMKNFEVEVRGIRDVENLLQVAVILLRPKSVVLSDLIEEILGEIKGSVSGYDEFYQEAKEELFIDTNTFAFANTMQGFVQKENEQPHYDHSWLCAFCDLSHIRRRYVVIARMKQPTNFGETCQEVRFFVLVLCPSKTKETKTALETSRTFATMFSDPNLRNSLLLQPTEESFKHTLSDWAAKISVINTVSLQDDRYMLENNEKVPDKDTDSLYKRKCCFGIGSGIKEDLQRRAPHYMSDYVDGIADARSMQKTVSTSVFLYFACLLPTIAFATLNSKTTHGKMDVRRGIFSQTVGQLIFAVIGGQHLSILLTTAPLSLFVYIIYSLSEYFNIEDLFEAFYCCVGLWTCFFLFLSAIFNLSFVMKYCTRSTEEIFALFISIAFVVYAVKDVVHDFQHNYTSSNCSVENQSVIFHANNSLNNAFYRTDELFRNCHRDSSLLYLLLMFGTFWLGYTLYNFKYTPFLQRNKREILSDYSLPLAVVIFSFIGSYLFQSIPAERFHYNASRPLLELAPLYKLDWKIILVSAGLGFCLAVLIFMDQNIGSAIVNNPSNKLKKGPAYNWDLVVISIINVFCSLFTLPWLHVALPHAPMHVKCLADIEERVEHGQLKQTVILVRETRLTTILSHVLMGFSLYLLPNPLSYILPSVFDGLYLYMGITALGGNQMFERILLFFTEQTSYPPNHYIRQVPQRKIHQFTLVQVLQLLVLCVLGFFPFPFVKVLFPLVLLFLLFSRQKLLPKLIEKKYLDVLD